MISTLRLTHLIYLGWVGLHVSVYIDHPQAQLWIVFLQLLATYWDPAMFTNYASVHACYKYIKLGGGTVGGTRSLRGCCVSSRRCRAASLLPAIVKTRFANGPEDGLCRPKHVAPLNLSKLNKLDVLDVKYILKFAICEALCNRYSLLASLYW